VGCNPLEKPLRFLLRKVEALLKSERNSDTDSRSKAYNQFLTKIFGVHFLNANTLNLYE